MSENLISTETENSEKHQQAVELHRSVMLNAELAAASFIAFCSDLKKMRDSALYEQLGFDTFEDYTTNAVGLKQRQAYNYISVLENLEPKLLQDNASLGVTKLGLLIQVPTSEQIDFAADNDLAGMTVDEIKEAVKKYHDQSEQLSLLEAEVDELKAGAGEVSDEVRAAIERDAREEAEKTYKEKVKDIKDKAVAAAQKEMAAKLTEAAEKAKQDALDDTAEAMKTMEAEVSAAKARAADLAKRLEISSNQTTLKFSFYFEDLQITVNKMLELIDSCEAEDEQVRLRGAVVKYIDMIREKAN